METTIPEMVTLREASARTGVSYDCLRKMCLRNEIPNIRTGVKFLINFTKLCQKLNGEEI